MLLHPWVGFYEVIYVKMTGNENEIIKMLQNLE